MEQITQIILSMPLLFLVLSLLLISGIFLSLAYVGMIYPRIGHKIFGWHHVSKTSSFDGASLHGNCDICGKDCMQDSQGNWF